MPRIIVQPEHLHNVSAQMRQHASDVHAILSRLSGALGSLDWQVRSSAGVEDEWNRARSLAYELANHANDLARTLTRNAQTFEEADRASAANLGQVLGALTARQPAHDWARQLSIARLLPEIQPAQFLLDLGKRIGDAPLAIAAPIAGLTAALGGWFAHHQFLNPPAPRWEQPLQNAATRQIEKGGLERAVKDGFARIQPEPIATPAATIKPAQWWNDVPTQSQRDLTYRGARTEYGCTVTSASMILDYYHAQAESNRTMSAQDLLNTNAQAREFTATGMSATNLHDDLDQLGYTAVDYTNATQADLVAAVKDGPVIAIVKLNLAARGDNHAVVVSGISEDNQVRVNDPWTGEARTYSWDDFSASWGANFGKDAPTNNFVTIRPK
jgi:WXG100 family type VII secretion target